MPLTALAILQKTWNLFKWSSNHIFIAIYSCFKTHHYGCWGDCQTGALNESLTGPESPVNDHNYYNYNLV